MKKFAEIDKCKSDIASLEESIKQTAEIDKCKSDIASLEESIKQTTKKIPDPRKISDIQRDILNLKTSRVLVSAFQSKIRDIETQLRALDTIVKHLGENDKERLNETKTWVPLLVGHDKIIKDLKSQVDLIDDTVNDTIITDIIEDINTQNSSINNLNDKIQEIYDIVSMLGENDKERLKETKTTTDLLVTHDNDISQLKTQISMVQDPLELKQQYFSLNSKGVFYRDLKKTLFFSPGLILPNKTYVYSLYITTNIKAKHDQKFEFVIVKNGVVEPIHSFEKDVSQELIMEDFNPPIEIPSKTKMLISCNKKLDGMVLLTISY
jgi:hypothetical protein